MGRFECAKTIHIVLADELTQNYNNNDNNNFKREKRKQSLISTSININMFAWHYDNSNERNQCCDGSNFYWKFIGNWQDCCSWHTHTHTQGVRAIERIWNKHITRVRTTLMHKYRVRKKKNEIEWTKIGREL